MTSTLEGYLTTAGVAERTGLTVASVYVYVRRGALPPPVRVGRTLVWSEEAIDGWVAERVARLEEKLGRPVLPDEWEGRMAERARRRRRSLLPRSA